jgi:RNA polymerase sigma-70 factor (ECF subfamily)
MSGAEGGASATGVPASGVRLDARSFGAAFQAASRALWCIAVAIVRDRDLAHDVVQESAVVALKKLDEFDASTSFQAWAGQIVRYVALNERRRRIRAGGHEDPSVPGESAGHTRQGDSPDADLRGKLSEAVGTLDDTARACLLMRTVMDMSYRDIAATLGIPEGTAMSHVHRSRQSLRTMLAPAWEGRKGAAR